MKITFAFAIICLFQSLIACSDHNPSPSSHFRTKSVNYYKLRYGTGYRQEDRFFYDHNNNLDSALNVIKGGPKGSNLREGTTVYKYDSKDRITSFDYTYYITSTATIKRGYIKNFTYDEVNQTVTTIQTDYDSTFPVYVSKLKYNTMGQLDGLIYENGNVTQEEKLLFSPGGRVRYLYEYDDRPNPLYHLEGWPEYLTNARKYSKNNLKKVTVQQLSDDGNTITSTHTYVNTLTYNEQGLLTYLSGGDQSYNNTFWDYQEFSFSYEAY